MKAPEGYRELEVGEVIQGDDLAFASGKWIKEQLLPDEAIGHSYTKLYYPTFRKIDKTLTKEPKKEKNQWHFFYFKRKEVPLIVSNSKGGYLFYSNGKPYFSEPRMDYSLSKIKSYYERLCPKAAISLISEKGRSNVLNVLGITNEDITIPVNEDDIKSIVEKLKKGRAFNGDSAMPMDDKRDICYELESQGLIKRQDNRFYV